jgi:hypothetical protein
VAYSPTKRHRIKEGAEFMLGGAPGCSNSVNCLFALPVEALLLTTGAAVMATTQHNHWLYVDFTDEDQVVRRAVLKLDGAEYRTILDTVRSATGIYITSFTGQSKLDKLIDGDAKAKR